MPIIFTDETHKYESIGEEEVIDWSSATTIISCFKQPFDPISSSVRASKSPKSKWYMMDPEFVRKIWKRESDRSTSLGNKYHKQQEDNYLECNTIDRNGIQLPIIRPVYDEKGIKIAPKQKIQNGIYVEHMMYLKGDATIGQADRIEVYSDMVDVLDYKTGKKIDMNSYVDWEGISKKMLGPLSHIEDCNYNHYILQASLYTYMIIKHNPRLRPGKRTIQHVMFFEEPEPDEYGYPITIFHEHGFPIVKQIVLYDLPYWRDEVVTMLKYYNANKEKLRKKK